MKRTVTLLLPTLLALSSMAQCSSVVLPNAVIVSNDTVITGSGFFWVCPGNTVTFNGGIAWVEENCTVTMNGASGQLWVDHDCDVSLNGTNHSVRHDASTTITDNSANSTFTLCAQVMINPSFPGACTSTAVAQAEHTVPTMVFPNPAADRITITLPYGERLVSAQLTDLRGREALRVEGPSRTIDVSGLAVGSYILEVLTEQRRIVEQLVVGH